MYTLPHSVEENIEHFLTNFRANCKNSDRHSLVGSTTNQSSQLSTINYPYPYTRGCSGSYYFDEGVNCWCYSWSSISESSSSRCTSPFGSVSEASSALGSFENPSSSIFSKHWGKHVVTSLLYMCCQALVIYWCRSSVADLCLFDLLPRLLSDMHVNSLNFSSLSDFQFTICSHLLKLCCCCRYLFTEVIMAMI